MNDRRGHRKLRLTSRKHFKPKPKRSACNTQPFDCNISLPLAAYVDGPVNTLTNLQSRLTSCGAIPSGVFVTVQQCMPCGARITTDIIFF